MHINYKALVAYITQVIQISVDHVNCTV